MGFGEQGRRYRGGHSVNSVSVGRRDDRTVWGRVLGIREVVDRNVWRSDAKKATPAHMYMDGVEYFPVSRYVLWGYQFKSVAALGPILGPFIGITFGWLPALLWIIGGELFSGGILSTAP